jgi:hypothetical protein
LPLCLLRASGQRHLHRIKAILVHKDVPLKKHCASGVLRCASFPGLILTVIAIRGLAGRAGVLQVDTGGCSLRFTSREQLLTLVHA